MNNLIFVDTCIVIDYINGRVQIEHSELERCCFSSIVDMEVLAGVKNKRDLNTDAIIAATCLVYDLPLRTHNKKDFKFIDGLELIV